MELIFNNQLSILIDILPFHLTPKQCTKLYTSNIILYNIYNTNNKFENNYFIPKNKEELQNAVDEWCSNKDKAIIKYGNISFWNTIYITYMDYLFKDKKDFNDDISDWNTSNVYNMACMFYNAKTFNKDISNWNTNNIISMNSMFFNCYIFNQNLNKWNLKNVKYINYIFYFNTNFDKLNCKDWNLDNIEYTYQKYMFDNQHK